RFLRPKEFIRLCFQFFSARTKMTCAFVLSAIDKTARMLTINSVVQRETEIVSAELDQDLMMVSIATGHYYALSDVARQVWAAIERPTRISDLIADLTSNYNVDSASCEEQTLSFLGSLFDEGLLQVKNAPPD